MQQKIVRDSVRSQIDQLQLFLNISKMQIKLFLSYALNQDLLAEVGIIG